MTFDKAAKTFSRFFMQLVLPILILSKYIQYLISQTLCLRRFEEFYLLNLQSSNMWNIAILTKLPDEKIVA